jgi:2-oxoisovalerate dehydrogenase E2 component (dihydrolipoyl transacylase)
MPAFLLPDLGEGLTEAEIVAWHVGIGDTVTVDQSVVEVETAKAAVEIPVPFAGRVTELHGKPGDVVAVGEPLITVDTEDRAAPAPGRVPQEQQAPGPGPEPGFAEPGMVSPAAVPGDAGQSGNVLIGYGTSSGHRRHRRAPRPSASAPAPSAGGAGTAATGAATGSTVPSPASNGPVAVASPLIRQLARNAGVDITAIRGSGRGRLITRQDVDAAISARRTDQASGPEPAPAIAATAGPSGVTRIAIRGARKSAADKVSRSRREIPEATVWVDVDATEMVSLRTALNADGSAPKISLLALLSRFTILGLRRYPELNARVDGDEIVMSPSVHLGFAAQTDRGLVVPVVPDAQAHSLEQLSTALAERTLRAREGTLGPAELTGGTFTVNNYGVFGVDGSAAIINHPEVAILGIGRIIQRPWVIDGQIVPRQMTELTLAFDHRVCDGGTAGGFLRFIADCVESPAHAFRHL